MEVLRCWLIIKPGTFYATMPTNPHNLSEFSSWRIKRLISLAILTLFWHASDNFRDILSKYILNLAISKICDLTWAKFINKNKKTYGYQRTALTDLRIFFFWVSKITKFCVISFGNGEKEKPHQIFHIKPEPLIYPFSIFAIQ